MIVSFKQDQIKQTDRKWIHNACSFRSNHFMSWLFVLFLIFIPGRYKIIAKNQAGFKINAKKQLKTCVFHALNHYKFNSSMPLFMKQDARFPLHTHAFTLMLAPTAFLKKTVSTTHKGPAIAQAYPSPSCLSFPASSRGGSKAGHLPHPTLHST